MSRPTVAALLSVAATAAVAAPSASAASARPARCEDRAGSTLAAGPRARVFAVPGKSPYRSVLACAVGSRRTVKLGVASECMGVTQVDEALVRGRYVAFRTSSCGLDSGDATVGLLDVATRRVRWRAPAFAGPPPTAGSTTASDLALSAIGTVAWFGDHDRDAREVHVRTLAGGDQTVDTGTPATIADLALGAHTAFWQHDGAPRTAPA